MKLQSKAFVINNCNFQEPYYVPDTVYYAGTPSVAKSKILSDIRYDDFKDYKGEIINFLTLKVKRAKMADKYLVDGKIKTLFEIEYDNKVKERNDKFDKLLDENPDGKAYIKKGGYYYRENHCGYTEFKTEAGVYNLKEAIRSVKNCSLGDCMDAILINIEEHNKMINEKIEFLKKKLI